MLDLNALESFIIAAETLNFSRTAERKNTVQSAVSAHINKLEEELGHPLFERGRGLSMRLTEEGRAFLAYAQRIADLSSEAVETIRTARGLKTIRLGTTVTLAMSVVARALQRFAAERPDVQIHIFCDRSDALLPLLDADEIDIAFMMDQGRRTSRIFAETSPLVWAAGPDFKLDPSADAPLVFLTDGRDLRRYAFEALDRAGRRGYIAHLSPHPVGVRAFVMANLALTIMPGATIAPPFKPLGDADGLPKLGDVAISLYQQTRANRQEIETLKHLLQSEMKREP